MRDLILLNLLILLIVSTSQAFASTITNSASNLTISPQKLLNMQPKFHECSNGAVIRPTEKCPSPIEEQGINFTQLFSTSNFEDCTEGFHGIECFHPVKVLHQGANLLVLKSDLEDNPHLIWSAVVVAKSYGYRVDDVAYAVYTKPAVELLVFENVIVTMSK